MILQRAILHVLLSEKLPVPARIIAAKVPEFGGNLPPNKAEAAERVALECEDLQIGGDVMFQTHRDFGKLWTITQIGRERIGAPTGGGNE
jgi:hypothetical protein